MKNEYLKVKQPLSTGNIFTKFSLLRRYYQLFFFIGIFVIALISMVPGRWQKIEMNNISFEYQGKFKNSETSDDDNLLLKSFYNDKNGKIAIYYMVDIKNKIISSDDIFDTVLEMIFENLHIKNPDFSDIEIYSDAMILRPSYRLNHRDLKANIFFFQDGSLLDIIFFMPYESNYSEKKLNRIISSIQKKI